MIDSSEFTTVYAKRATPCDNIYGMSRPEEYFLVFANSDYTLDLSRFLRTESTEGWHFFQGKENIGVMLVVRSGEMHYVHASFTRELDRDKITSYIRSLLWSLNV